MKENKPSLAILIGNALAKKGKSKSMPIEDDESSSEGNEKEEHLQEVADELVSAFHEKDSMAVKDLLQEFFECMESYPHEEAESE